MLAKSLRHTSKPDASAALWQPKHRIFGGCLAHNRAQAAVHTHLDLVWHMPAAAPWRGHSSAIPGLAIANPKFSQVPCSDTSLAMFHCGTGGPRGDAAALPAESQATQATQAFLRCRLAPAVSGVNSIAAVPHSW
eukprot:scaffold26040_cov117-Isochrysis_galbana.AAC.3